MKIEELIKLIEAAKASEFAEFILEAQDVKLTLRRGGGPQVVAQPASVASQAASEAPGSQPQPAAPTSEPVRDENLVDVLAPMVGTFYQAPAPGAEPFVCPGSQVKSGDTLCILEAMKLMNEIEAEIEGEVVEVAVQNGDLVEFGQILMMLRPTKS